MTVVLLNFTVALDSHGTKIATGVHEAFTASS